MDYILMRLEDGKEIPMPHGQVSRFKTEAEAIARAHELRGEAAALGDVALPLFAVVFAETDERVWQIEA